MCHGVFDLLHVLHQIPTICKKTNTLIVTITPDIFVNKGPSRPAFTNDACRVLRHEVVDYVAINSIYIIETIELLQPHLYIKGPDYKGCPRYHRQYSTKKDAVEAVGGKLVSQMMKHSVLPIFCYNFQIYTQTAKQFHQLRSILDFEKIQQWFEKLEKLRVLVVGETIIDEYAYCDALGKSGKEPVLNIDICTKSLILEVFWHSKTFERSWLSNGSSQFTRGKPRI